VIFAEGGRRGGFSLYLKDGKAVYELNTLGKTHEKIVSSEPLPPGKARISVDFVAEGKNGLKNPVTGRGIEPGVGRLSVNGTAAGETYFAWLAPSQRRLTSAAISARQSATTTRRRSCSPARWKESRWN
jgi:hypothetical protein